MAVWRLDFSEGLLTGLRLLLRSIVSSGIVRAVVCPIRGEQPEGSRIALISDEKRINSSLPFYPVFFQNYASCISKLTRVGHLPEKVAVVVRPCEIRSCVELVKLNQIKRDNLVFITGDCAGTISGREFLRSIAGRGGGDDASTSSYSDIYNRVESAFASGKLLEGARKLCVVCTHPVVEEGVDLRLGFYGLEKAGIVYPLSEIGEEICLHMKACMREAERIEVDKNRSTLEREVSRRLKLKSELKKEFESNFTMGGIAVLLNHFRNCILCRACSELCPACYCKECFFKISSFEIDSCAFLMKAVSKGLAEIPFSHLYYHIGRMIHTAHLCTSCGGCTEVCPTDIDVGYVFSMVGEGVQGLFDYKAGMRADSPPPLVTYREDEFEEEIR